MQSPTNDKFQSEIAIKTTWLLLAVAINALELVFPRLPFLPWLKPGLANTITILWIVKFGLSDALLFSILRVWISSFYFGFSLLTLSLGLGGGIVATLSMGIVWNFLGKRGLIGSIGLGMIGALFHNLGQLVVVYFFIASNFRILYQMPFMFIAAIIFGGTVGALVPVLIRIFQNTPLLGTPLLLNSRRTSRANVYDKIAVILMLCVSAALLFTSNLLILSSTALLLTLTSLKIGNWKWSIIVYPLKFYWMFLFIGVLYLFFTFGTRLESVPIITIEGLQKTIAQWIRLWAWLQATHIFKRFRFHDQFFTVMGRVFPQNSSTLDAGIIALELFPETVTSARQNTPVKALTNLFTKPVETFRNYTEEMNRKICAMISEKNRMIKESEAG